MVRLWGWHEKKEAEKGARGNKEGEEERQEEASKFRMVASLHVQIERSK